MGLAGDFTDSRMQDRMMWFEDAFDLAAAGISPAPLGHDCVLQELNKFLEEYGGAI